VNQISSCQLVYYSLNATFPEHFALNASLIKLITLAATVYMCKFWVPLRQFGFSSWF